MNFQSLIDSTDYEHSRKVSELSGLLAKYLGYSCSESQTIKEAALFHDVGKCDIPREILNKPDELTPKEFSIVKCHAQLGSERINEALRVLTAAREIVENHHEKWDGSGYHGLAGEEIHPYSRLVSVVDVFDALSSKRAYKAAWDINEVFRYFVRQSGIQFDRNIIAAMLAHADEIAALYR